MLRTWLAHESLLKNGFYFNHGLVQGYVDMSTGRRPEEGIISAVAGITG